jgi:hypothetical protein
MTAPDALDSTPGESRRLAAQITYRDVLAHCQARRCSLQARALSTSCDQLLVTIRVTPRVTGVLHNESLAADIAAAEAQVSADSPTETVEHVRLALIAALQARHATQR